MFWMSLGLVLMAASPCRTPDLGHDPAWSALEGGGFARSVPDLDGDGQAERLETRHVQESIRLSFSATGRTLEAVAQDPMDDEKYHLVSFVPVPEELVGTRPAVVAARRAVEDALFYRVCEAQDPSLRWLLARAHRLQWEPDPFRMPEQYTVYSAAPADLAYARSNPIEPSRARAPIRGVWFTYRGANHGNTADFHQTSEPRVLATRGAFALLGTAHGVLLADRGRHRHAWIFIQPGGVKLRFPTIRAARFDGRRAVVEISLGQMEKAGRATIDLKTGAVHVRYWHVPPP